jgi:hypothetical protein
MTTERSPKPDLVQTFVRIAALAAATAALLACIGYFPTLRLSGTAGVGAMLVGIAVALVGAWIGSLIPILFIRPDPRVFLNGLLIGLGARFVITLALALLLRAMGVGPAKPLLLWVGIGQVVILATDTVGLLRLVRRLSWEGKQ